MIKIKDKYPDTILEEFFGEATYIEPVFGPSLRLVVAEAAGEEENAQGLPLVGGSGRIFDNLIRRAGIQRAQLSIINTLPCRPPDNLYPTDAGARVYCTTKQAEEILKFSYDNYVKPVLDARPWTRIDAVGNKSLLMLTGRSEGIMKWRGSPLPLIGESKPRVIGILHPSYLMRDSAMIPATISDLQKGIQVPPQYYTTKPTLEEVKNFHAKILVADIETNRFTNQITMVGIADAQRAYHVVVVPFHGAYIEELCRIFLEAEEIVGQNNISFDIPILALAGVVLKPECQLWDTMLMHHLLQPNSPHDLEFIASIFTQMVAWKHLNAVDMEWYNASDVDATAQIFNQLKPLLTKYRLLDLYKYVQVPLAKICKSMHEVGIKVDPSRIKTNREKFLVTYRELEEQLPIELKPYDKVIKVRQRAPIGTLGKSGKPIKFIHVPGSKRIVPWQSSRECEKWLYETKQLPKQFHAKTKKITSDKTALNKLYNKFHYPELKVLQELRSLEELLSTFFKEETDTIQPVTRVHSNFLVHGTVTGRLSSSGPNLQNLPPQAKYLYVPSFADWCFVEADFSSLENRLAAWYADDSERLTRLALPNFNEHRWLASQIFKKPELEIDKKSDEYSRAKHTNHGADAGMGPRKMSIQYNVPEKDCRYLLGMWKELNCKSAQWQERTGNKALKDGILTTNFGRKGWYWTKSGYTEGIRFMLQSSGADICFRAMIALCYEHIQWPEELARKVAPVLAPLPHPARLIVQVHDSLLIECPYTLREQVVECLKKAMAQPWPELAGYCIPIDIKVGEPLDSWAELK